MMWIFAGVFVAYGFLDAQHYQSGASPYEPEECRARVEALGAVAAGLVGVIAAVADVEP